MKKFLTGLACFALVLVGGVSLAACCGNDSIVDTSGNYINADIDGVQTALAGFSAEDVEAYEFRLIFNAEIDGVHMDLNYQGKLDALNNASLDMDFNMSGSQGGNTLNLTQNGQLYYDASTNYYYLNSGDLKQKSASFGGSTDMFSTFKNMINADYIYSQYFLTPQESDVSYQISTSGGYTKVHLTIVEQMDNGETSTGNIYFITDSENNFVGFQMIGNIEGGNITLEFISTTGAVEFPSDLDSYVEA